ncbi:hypothetical protein THAOC_01187 [Thalassiosira oceanica]|uniref:2Fe-2S ferredoxin-type domain-containing protein n=1 Tax=Thalassiosira oceanica TaxID=159749 RepID=K0TE65_THAOC|nr:hypothetical protein THAOC_01187 [Thalassiosira oceanica]|eukprot:EJK77013.1 hypothetical protein THAOC_01187 [Thalassiosira oceanica]
MICRVLTSAIRRATVGRPLPDLVSALRGRNDFPTVHEAGISYAGAKRRLSSQSPTEQTLDFLTVELGYSEAIANGVVDALLKNGITPSSLFGMVKSLAGRYEVDEDGGLEALAASVEAELASLEGKKTVKMVCVPSTGWSSAPEDDDGDGLPKVHSMDRAFVVEAFEGSTLTGEYIECACAGIMGCSTCHVIISPEWFSSDGDETTKIGPPCEAELDMIDLAYETEVTSRLGCQIKLIPELDGLVVLLPAGSNNLMVSRVAGIRWKAHALSLPNAG